MASEQAMRWASWRPLGEGKHGGAQQPETQQSCGFPPVLSTYLIRLFQSLDPGHRLASGIGDSAAPLDIVDDAAMVVSNLDAPPDRCKGVQFPWRWDRSNISTNAGVIRGGAVDWYQF